MNSENIPKVIEWQVPLESIKKELRYNKQRKYYKKSPLNNISQKKPIDDKSSKISDICKSICKGNIQKLKKVNFVATDTKSIVN